MPATLPIETFGARGGADEAGSGTRPVVFLHGAFVTHAMGRFALPPALVDRHPCVSVGLPGHPGAPANAWPDRTAEGLAAAIAATLDDAGIGPDAAVIGHSLGALAGLCLAVHRPGRIAGLACVAGTAGGLFRPGVHDTLLQRVARVSAEHPLLFRLGVRTGSCSAGLHRWLAGFSAGDAAALRANPRFRAAADAYLPALWRARTEPMRHALRALAGLDLRDHLSGLPTLTTLTSLTTLTTPTLFLHGAADPVFPAAQAELAARRCPAASFVPLPGVGHLPMFEAPAACDAALCGWIRRLAER